MVFRRSKKNSKVFKFNKVFAKLIVPSIVGSMVLSPFPTIVHTYSVLSLHYGITKKGSFL